MLSFHSWDKVWSTDQSVGSNHCWVLLQALAVCPSLEADHNLSCTEICQYGCWSGKRPLRMRLLSVSAFLVPSIYTKAQFNFQQQESLFFFVLDLVFIHKSIYFPRDTAQSVKEKFGKKLYNALLKWVCRLFCSALQTHIFIWFTCDVLVLLLFV